MPRVEPGPELESRPLKSPSPRVIVGLGNPGPAYSSSRHNVGFLAIDALIARQRWPLPRTKRHVDYTEGELEGEHVLLLKPLTYMNRSGPALRQFLSMLPVGEQIASMAGEAAGSAPGSAGRAGPGGGRRRRAGLRDRLLVIHDDLDLPLGRLRFRGQGSSGGHRGVESVISALGTSDFGRLKVGIGKSDDLETVDYVLEPLRGERLKALQSASEMAAETLPSWVREGLDTCANRFNGQKFHEDPGTKAPENELH